MRLRTNFLTLVLLAGTLVGPGVRAQETAPSDEALSALHQFLMVDCEVGDESSVMTDLVQHAAALEPELGRLLLEGPDEQSLLAMTAGLEHEWARRTAFLDEVSQPGLDDETLQALLAVSREAFVEQGLRDFVLSTREKAIVGLNGFGTRTAQRRLRHAITVVEDAQVREMILGAMQGQRLLERQQPATERATPYRESTRRGLN
jgi:hypothetical protein